MECSCCGNERDPQVLTPLQCHQDIKVCRGCIGWLRGHGGGLNVTPILPVGDMATAVSFYETAGFEVHVYEGGGYAFVHYEEESAFDLDLSEHVTPPTNGAGCFIITPDVDGWHARLSEVGLPVTAVQDQPWGMREFTLTDPSGNHLRIATTL